MVSYWKEIVRKKEGKHVSRVKIQKQKDIAESNNQQDTTTNKAKVQLRVAIEKWKEHVKKMKKQKEEEILNMQGNTFDDEDENDIKKKDKKLKSKKKTLVRNSDFRYLACNFGKGQKNGSRRM